MSGELSHDLAALERRLGHRFKSAELLETALTHRSHAHESGGPEHFQ